MRLVKVRPKNQVPPKRLYFSTLYLVESFPFDLIILILRNTHYNLSAKAELSCLLF